MKILVVDDEGPARRRLLDLLQDIQGDCPHQVVGEAVNGIEGLALAEQLHPDLILADMQMPRMGGLEMARHLLKLAALLHRGGEHRITIIRLFSTPLDR